MFMQRASHPSTSSILGYWTCEKSHFSLYSRGHSAWISIRIAVVRRKQTPMSKRATPLKKPEIMLDQNASAPLYRQLYERLRGSILSGQLEAGTCLPSTRVLASSLGVSRTITAPSPHLTLQPAIASTRRFAVRFRERL